jgi:hypothetical protein
MSPFEEQMEQAQRHYIRRNALIESAYVQAPVDSIIHSQKERLARQRQHFPRSQSGTKSEVPAAIRYQTPRATICPEDRHAIRAEWASN